MRECSEIINGRHWNFGWWTQFNENPQEYTTNRPNFMMVPFFCQKEKYVSVYSILQYPISLTICDSSTTGLTQGIVTETVCVY